jgi:curli biogenesis system outer membrane secretion channel CsgG
MRKILSLALVAVLALAAGSGEAQQRRKRVAVFDFDYATVHGGVAAIFGQDIDVGKGVSDLLIANLVKDGTYSVIERGALDKILREQNFSNSERANPASAARIGKLLGVDAIVVGSITQFGNETKNTGIGSSAGGWGGFGVGGFSQKKSKAIVALTARIVDIDTAEILAVADGRGESKRESTSLLGGGGSWHGWGTGGVNFGSSDFQSTIIGEAVKAAVDTLSVDVIAGQAKLQTRAVPITGVVAAVEGSEIVLNIGSSCGLAVGDRLAVERVSREVTDPATGKVIRRLATQIGVLRVVEVDEVSAIAAVVSGSGFKVGDAVRPVQK